MSDGPSGLSADDLLTEIQRLYQQLKTIGGMADLPRAQRHDRQSILMAQIRVHADRYTQITEQQKTTTSSCRAAERSPAPTDRISAESPTS